MAITLNGHTKLTQEAERLFVELGGANPDKTLTDTQLSIALVNALEQLTAVKSPLLEKLYQHIASQAPGLPSLEDLRQDIESQHLKNP